MKYKILKPSLVIAVIFLFFGVAVAPGINGITSQEPLEDEYVEYTTEVCGLPGLQPQTIKLTRQQANEVEKLFQAFKSKLDTAVTQEETISIYNQVVIELDRYGLLGGLNVKQAQDLITGRYQRYYMRDRFENPLCTNLGVFDNNSNYLCLISGSGQEIEIFGALSLARQLFYIFVIWNLRDLFDYITGHQTNFGKNLSGINAEIGGKIAFGFIDEFDWEHPELIPARGWVSTTGLNGIKSWSGNFSGKIRLRPSIFAEYCIGATGFLGYRIGRWMTCDGMFFGTAFKVKAEYVP